VKLPQQAPPVARDSSPLFARPSPGTARGVRPSRRIRPTGSLCPTGYTVCQIDGHTWCCSPFNPVCGPQIGQCDP